MSLQNLPEDKLYDFVPEGIVAEDTQGIMQAVIGGFADHLSDLRSYVSKYELFFATSGLPEPTNHIILVQLQSDQGKVYTRTLDKKLDTPTDATELIAWSATELGVETTDIVSVVEGDDLLCKVDLDTLQYLALSVGAILFQSVGQNTGKVSAARIMDSYFPRLKIKGTAMSFDALGRLIGFDDVMLASLYQRLSPRMPSDIGAPQNNPDFSKIPDFYVSQDLGVQYDPWAMRDGPFYHWRVEATSDTTSIMSYQQVINGNSPWIRINQIGTSMEVVPTGAYVLAGGGPHCKAKVSLPEYGLEFEALGEGESFNGMIVNSLAVSGSTSFISILDRLSSLKYRSSYFDMAMTVTDEQAIALFGTVAAKKNVDLATDPSLCTDGDAISPYRPWTGGTLSQGQYTYDFLTSIGTATPLAGYTGTRSQATLSDKQIDTTPMIAAGAQAVAYMEEVRPATRFPRQAGVGLLTRDDVIYAAYPQDVQVLATTYGTDPFSFQGTHHPLGDYDVQMRIETNSAWQLNWVGPYKYYYGTWTGTYLGTLLAAPESPQPFWQFQVVFDNGLAPWIWTPLQKITGLTGQLPLGDYLPWQQPILGVVYWPDATRTIGGYTNTWGTYSEQMVAEYDGTDTSRFDAAGTYGLFTYTYGTAHSGTAHFSYPIGNDVKLIATYEPYNTDIIRPDPTSIDLSLVQSIGYQVRPEDEPFEDLPYETSDEYPWRRAIIGGGELIETDNYQRPSTLDLSLLRLSDEMAIKDQTGAEYTLYGLNDPTQPVRVTLAVRSLDPYVPGQPAVAYVGDLRNLGTLTANDLALVHTPNRYDMFGTTTSLPNDLALRTGYGIYQAGLVNGVLVADPVKFNGAHHRDGLVAWMPFNEHSGDGLVVRDASAVGAVSELSGVLPEGRVWDEERGWVAQTMGSVVFDSHRNLTDAYSVAFWFKPTTASPQSNGDVLFKYGPLRLDHVPKEQRLLVYQANDSGTWGITGFVPYTFDRFNHLSVTYESGTVVSRFGFKGSPSSEIVLKGTVDVRPYESHDSELVLKATGSETAYFNDFRMWNNVKTRDEVELIKYHEPGTIVSTLYPTWFESANNQERYTLKVLPSGWLTPGDSMPWVKQTKLARAIRYNALGQYVGDSRFKEVGLGGGQFWNGTLATTPWCLGQQFVDISATGTVVASGTIGQLPGGSTASWGTTPHTGLYLKLPYDYLTSTGFNGTYATAPGGSAYWPNNMDWTNPCRDRIWLEGKTGYVYEVTMSSTIARGSAWPVMVAERIAGTRTSAEFNLVGNLTDAERRQLSVGEQRTGAIVEIAQPGRRAVVALNGSTVMLEPWSGTFVRPDVFMYSNSKSVVHRTQATAYAAWEDVNSFGYSQVPPVAALNTAGQLSFVESTAAPLGRYQLSITSGNIGKTDPQFDGFNVDIVVGDTLLEGKKLLVGESGNNVRGVDVFEFDLDHPLPGAPASWLLSLDWSNPYSNPATGVIRQLGVYGYELRQLTTELYQVSLTDSTTAPVITLVSVDSGTGTFGLNRPGGWIEYVNSFGTVVRSEHEATIYPGNDTLTSRYPLSDVLTATTVRKTEDHVYNGTQVFLVDLAWAEPPPPFGSVKVI